MNTAIYVRVSTADQAIEGYSIQEQIERLKKYCEAMNWNVYKIYTDAGFTGSTTDRPALTEMLRDIKQGKINKVLVYKLDRLSRSQLDTLYLIEKVFLAKNVDFVSMSENFDTATPFGRAMIGILAVFAQLEREQIKERMKMGKEARAKEGKFRGSWNIPIGYDYKNDELITNDYEKLQVLEVFRMFFDDVPIKRMIAILHEKGFKHKYGEWNDRTIRNVLRSRYYLGYINYCGEWFKGSHEAFITEQQHDLAVEMLDKRKQDYDRNRRPGKVQSYLGGLLICKQCGAKYSKRTSAKSKDGSQRHYYSCNSRIKASPQLVTDPDCKNKSWRMEELDQIIFDEISKLKTDEEYYQNLVNQSSEDEKNRPEVIRAELERLRKQTVKLMDLYVSGDFPLSWLQTKMEDINVQKEHMETELESIRNAQKKDQSKEKATEMISTFAEAVQYGDFKQLRGLIEALIDHIELDGENIEIHWNF